MMFKLKATKIKDIEYWKIPYTYKKGKSPLKPGDHITIDNKQWYVREIFDGGDPQKEEIQLGPISFTYSIEPNFLKDGQIYYESYKIVYGTSGNF